MIPAADPTLATAAVARAEGVTKSFGATVALEEVSIEIDPGECHGLVGRNGAGKSTLVGVLTGLITPDEGRVWFHDQPAPAASQRPRWRQHVACVYQRSTVIPSLTVGENLVLNSHPRGQLGVVRWRILRERAQALLDEWEIEAAPDTPASSLTVAQRQLVEIARALYLGTRFIVLDEPTARLEAGEIQKLFRRMRNLQATGVSFLYISHHLDEVYDQCQRVTVLRDGRNVLRSPVASLPKTELVEAMVGDAKRVAPQGPTPGAAMDREALLRVRDLSLAGSCAGVSLDVRAGECVGLAGLAGCGKALVADAIVGMIGADTGEVAVAGSSLRGGDVRHAIDGGVGYVPEDRHRRGLAPNLSVEENLTMSVLGRLGRFGFVGPGRRRRVARDLIDQLDIKASGPGQPVSELSGGNQQKAVMGRALASRPRVLVLVSPTAGVDVASKESLYAAIRGVDDAAVLLVSDELDELAICDRVLVMFDGRVVREYPRGWSERELVGAMEGVAP